MTLKTADVLVVGTSVDPHVSAVLQRLDGRLNVCRLDVDRYPREQQVTLQIGPGPGVRVIVNDGIHDWDVSAPKVAWFRRLGKPGLSPNLHPDYTDFATGEVEQTIEGLLSLVQAGTWLNPFWPCRQAGNKPMQYAAAIEVGLNLPDTLITNAPDYARRWLADHDRAIAKSISRPLLTPEHSSRGRTFAYTHELTSEDLTHLDSIAYTPGQFQPLARGSSELRVTTIGNHHIAVEIIAFDDEPHRHDWRATATTCEYRLAALDKIQSRRLDLLMQKFGLEFAASDFIVGEDGELTFLESNPHGAWMWLEAFVPGLDITGEIASWISTKCYNL